MKILITGATRGIGKEIAILFAKHKHDIIFTYNKNFELALQLEKELKEYNVDVSLYHLDITNTNEINELVSNIGNIDILVNNAALSMDNNIEEKTKKEFEQVLGVNLIGPFMLIKKIAPIMKKGVIINICSTDGIDTYSNISVDYCASKAGLINLTQNLATYYKDIRLYALCPNWVNTESVLEMNKGYLRREMKRIGQKKLIDKKDVAKMVYDLVKSKKKSGSIVRMD
ncbi:MAG: SDR family oxidoreductase [Bacilli bacterium]|nr:SDR family oxidoreductase [Bacilli bacterium]